MAYVKTVWATGDVITAEKLNNMENGIESASNVLTTEIVLSDNAPVRFDMTYNEIKSAMQAKKPIFVIHSANPGVYGVISEAFFSEDLNKYCTSWFDFTASNLATYGADSSDGYPEGLDT